MMIKPRYYLRQKEATKGLYRYLTDSDVLGIVEFHFDQFKKDVEILDNEGRILKKK